MRTARQTRVSQRMQCDSFDPGRELLVVRVDMARNGRDFRLCRSTVIKLVCLIGLLSVCVSYLLAAEPLAKEDVMLLVLSGATTQRKVETVQNRDIGFMMSPEIANQFRELGADDVFLCALQNARSQGDASRPQDTTRVAKKSRFKKTRPPAALSVNSAPACSAIPPGGSDLRAGGGGPGGRSALADPPAALIPRITTDFLDKDEAFRTALNNYNYHQLVIIKQLDESRNVVGVYHREWDVVFDDRGRKISRVVYAKPGTLKHIAVTEDNTQYFEQALFPTETRQDYDFKYVDHVRADKVTAYVFSARPKKIEPGKHYFEGTIWVEDQDLQIVKAEGKRVPSLRTAKRGLIEETLFPHFVEYRQQVDGTYWFPTVDFSDDTLQFAFGRVHVQVLVQYSNYRPFGAESHMMTSMSRLIFPGNTSDGQLAESGAPIVGPQQ